MFSVFILVFLWLFQVLFLKNFYRYSKTRDIEKVVNTITKYKSNVDLDEVINALAFEKGVCVEVVNKENNTLYSSSFLGKGCFTGKEDKMRYKRDFINSNRYSYTYELINPMFDNQTLVKAVQLDSDKYVFVNTSIEPIDSTVSILKNQLVVVTVVVLILSFIIAYFISKHISNPIVKMNKAAKGLASGDFTVVFDVSEDILELNELSDTLNHTRDELAKMDELKRDLMANVSHDLKTPLTMIKAYAEMNRDLHANNKKKREENMNIITNEVDRLTLLVNDILELSSMQSEMETLFYSSFDLVEVINQIIKKYSIFKETENYHFVYNGPDKLEVNADKKKIEQVIYNLVNNAINYTGDDNKVIINICDSESSILVGIVDTGKGIKDKDIPYIWDKYYKNKKKHKRNLVGTGLGLSIVKNILKLHGYKYGVKSVKDKGSTFYFYINK